VAFVDTEFEWQEQDWNCLLGSLTDLELFNLAVVRVRDLTSLGVFARLLTCLGLWIILGCLSLWSLGWFAVFGCGSFLCSLINDLHVEENVRWESILNCKIDLERLVELGVLWDNVD
jgi:hypothetical protein